MKPAGQLFQTSQFHQELSLGGAQRSRSAACTNAGPISTFESPILQHQHQLGPPLPHLQTADHVSISRSPVGEPVNISPSEPNIARPRAIVSRTLEAVQFSTVQIDILFQR